MHWPGMVICSASADCPGRPCGVYVGGYCRNFCPRPGVVCEPLGGRVDADEKVCKIPLSQGLFALVDPEDYEELSRYKWSVMRSDGTFYAIRRGPDGKGILMHRVIMKTPPGMVVDHIYGDGLDNRKRHMRNGTKAQNSYNHRPPCGGTSFKGVKYVALTGKYKATVGYKRKPIRVGEFDDPVEAAKARDRVARELHGEFAYLNFPDAFASSPRYVDLRGTIHLKSGCRGALTVVSRSASARS